MPAPNQSLYLQRHVSFIVVFSGWRWPSLLKIRLWWVSYKTFTRMCLLSVFTLKRSMLLVKPFSSFLLLKFHTGVIFSPSYSTDFSFILVERNCRKLLDTASQNRSKSRSFERGCRWFQLFYIDFQLFYFLTRIITDPNYRSDCTYK